MRERERDQTHSYWYIPSAPRVNYSLLVMESAGMMKMSTGDGSPLRQGAGTGSQLVLVAIEVCGSGTADLGYVLEVWGFIGEIGIENKPGGPQGVYEARGAPSTLVGPMGLPSGNSSFQYFLYFLEKISVVFQLNPRTFISAQKQHHGKLY